MERFTTDDGIEIAWYSWGDERAGVPVVLHHGFVANAELNWRSPGVVDALVAAGRWVVALDARGHGRSGAPHEAERYGEARMARDVSQLLDEIAVGSADLVGYSMGAVVALITAAREPRVRRLAVGGVGAGIVEHGGVDRGAAHPDDIAAALLADDPAEVTTAAGLGFRHFADAIGADRLALAAHASVAHGDPIPLERITAPTLVLAGTDDELAREPERLAAAIPDARLVRVPGDHLGAVGGRAFVEALVEFLGG